ncbi:MAG TPA: hypothetical protein VF292_06230 [Rhodanobacteraceae bacterium]
MDTKQLRIKYHNDWPIRFFFPAEEKFAARMRAAGLASGLVAVPLEFASDHQFQFYLGYLIDALDMLPMRPDLAFEHVWKALDAEFFLVQAETGAQGASRFDGFVDKVLTDLNTAGAFVDYIRLVPYQTCEYAAKRVIQASAATDGKSEILLTRAKHSLNEQFILGLAAKYPAGSNGRPSPEDQRKAGRLLKIIFSGSKVDLNGSKFQFDREHLIKFLVKVVLANSRNERFHGSVFPPFRSSSARLSTYAHAYFLLHLSYSLLLEVFLYRKYGVVAVDAVRNGIQHNTMLFKLLFAGDY